MAKRDFLTLRDLSSDELLGLIKRGIELKRMHAAGKIYEPLKNRVLAMVFEKASTRTRVSFQTAMAQFGGQAIFLSSSDTQLGRGEPLEDTARVLSRMVDCLVVRTFVHSELARFASASRVPVINALTDAFHPCQVLADMQTYFEHRGSIASKTVAWLGDGNNMCHSYIDAAKRYRFTLHIASPMSHLPDTAVLARAGDQAVLFDDPQEAVKGAALVVTDVWTSMGQEQEAERRRLAFSRYQVNETLMSLADPQALFMHCLPAHRGEEVSAGVIDGPQSVVWDEAGNRLHAQKALLEFLLT
ncbi:MAG: ornithine carbamoyltransferase [Gammaproteobacteria bacterium]